MSSLPRWSLFRHSDGVKLGRPYVLINTFVAGEERHASIVSLQSQKGYANIGWTHIPTIEPVLDRPSAVTLGLAVDTEVEIKSLATLSARVPPAITTAFIDNVRVALGLPHKYHEDRHSFTWHLAPPSIRTQGGMDRQADLSLLLQNGWHPPLQGTLYEIPSASEFYDDGYKFVVAISSNAFNTRFRFPEGLFLCVDTPNPMIQEGGITLQLSDVRDGELPAHLVAYPETIQSISFARWFGKCERCSAHRDARGKTRYQFWVAKLPSGERACLRCKTNAFSGMPKQSLWMKRVATVVPLCLDRLVAAAASYIDDESYTSGENT